MHVLYLEHGCAEPDHDLPVSVLCGCELSLKLYVHACITITAPAGFALPGMGGMGGMRRGPSAQAPVAAAPAPAAAPGTFVLRADV